MKVTYFLRDNGACGYYRVDLPLQTAKRNKALDVFKVEKGDSAVVIETGLTADIIVIPRVSDPSMLGIIKGLQEQGKKVIIDHDDNMFEISPFSPHYEEFGVEEVKVNLNGELISLWEDGKNINIKANREKLDTIKQALELADGVTTTTEILADVYREYNDSVYALPNCVNTKLWNTLPLKREDDTIRLYWSGGSSHYQDWLQLKDALPEIMANNKVKLVIMGSKFDGTLKNIDPSQIEFHPWVPTPAYPYKSAILDPDICIIPLEDNVFNRCKSAIKWIEMGALGVPSVCSLVSPYKEVYNGTNSVFIENNNRNAWVAGIQKLIDEPLLRWNIGGEAKQTVLDKFDINTQYTQWVDVYGKVLNGN